MPPQRSDFVLSAHVPNIEVDIFILDGLDVEPDSGQSGEVVSHLESVQNRRLARRIQTQH